MEDIRFYDFEFNLLAVQADFISANWQIYFNDIGQFEAHFSNDSDIVKIVAESPYIVAVQGSKAAIIVGWQSAEDFTVFGRTCNWILSKRVVPAFETKSKRAEEMVREFVKEAFSDVTSFVLAEDTHSDEVIELVQEDYRILSDVVKEALDLCNLGHKVIFDVKQKQWIFSIISPKELENIISEGNRNGANIQFSSDCIDRCSGAWYLKEQEKAEDGTEPDPIWTLKRSANLSGIYAWECVISAQTDKEAELELEKKKIKNCAKVLAVDFMWHKDYELGDSVKIRVEKNGLERMATMRIVGVHLWYEENDVGEQPIMEE